MNATYDSTLKDGPKIKIKKFKETNERLTYL